MRETRERRKQWDKEGLSGEEIVGRILEEGPPPMDMCAFSVDPRWELDWTSVGVD